MDAATIRANSKKDAEQRRRLLGPIYVPELTPGVTFTQAIQGYRAANSELLGPIYVPEWGTDDEAAEVYCKHPTVQDWEESKYTEVPERIVLTDLYDSEGAKIFSKYDKDDLELFQSETIVRIVNDINRLRVREPIEDRKTGQAIYFKSPTVAQSREFTECIGDPERGISETLITRLLDESGKPILADTELDTIRQFDKMIIAQILGEMTLYPNTPTHSNAVSRMTDEEVGND